MKKCKICGRKEGQVTFQAKRAECSLCRRRAERKTPAPNPEPNFATEVPEARTYVVTYAQNATPVHSGFLRALKKYCEHNNAHLLVIPGRYKNPTSIWSEDMEHDEWWAPDVEEYLFAGRAELGHVTIYGDISIQPTAVRPLTGFEVFAGANSAVFGHPKIQLHTIATAKRRYPRIFSTTGAVTKANYTHSKAGKKGEAHHVFGATIIEQGAALFHMRQITANADGSFIDLDKRYTSQGVTQAGRALALVCGDIHVAKSDAQVLEATFGIGSIARTLRPRQIVYHDVLDFDVRNHHTINDFNDRYKRALGHQPDSVEREVNQAIRFIDEATPRDTQPIVVSSNHDEAFDRWLHEANPKADPVNAKFFHEAWLKLLEAYEQTSKFPGAFELFYKERGAGRASFLGREDTLKIGDVYCNFHGDNGINGAKGNTLSYAKLGVKTIIGHSHSPAILDGCYQVGVTGRLDMGYNDTPSGWLNTHCVVYADGSRCLLHIIEGEWRGHKAERVEECQS